MPRLPQRLWNDFATSLLARDNRLLDFAVRLTAIAYIATLLLSWQTFIRSARIYSAAPVFEWLNLIPLQLDYVMLGAHLCALAVLLVRPRLWQAAVVSCVLTLIYGAGDIGRQQPFFFMFSFVILAAALPKVADEVKLQALRLMIVGVYFWAGFHKLDLSFYTGVFPWFIEPIWPESDSWPYMLVVFMAPFYELMIGVLLLFRRTRVLASLMAAIMLAIILICLGPLGHNWAQMVWPWNAWLHFAELALFLGPNVNTLHNFKRRWLAQLAVLLFILLPAGGTLACWPELFGFKLYSGNINTARVLLDAREDIARLPIEIQATAHNSEVFVFDWITRVGITPHPSEQVFRSGGKGLCPYLQYGEHTYIRVSYAAPFYSTVMPTRTFPLCAP